MECGLAATLVQPVTDKIWAKSSCKTNTSGAWQNVLLSILPSDFCTLLTERKILLGRQGLTVVHAPAGTRINWPAVYRFILKWQQDFVNPELLQPRIVTWEACTRSVCRRRRRYTACIWRRCLHGAQIYAKCGA